MVESVLGLSEVAISVLGEVEGVIRAAQGALEVAQEGVDGLELGQLGTGLAATGANAQAAHQLQRGDVVFGGRGASWFAPQSGRAPQLPARLKAKVGEDPLDPQRHRKGHGMLMIR